MKPLTAKGLYLWASQIAMVGFGAVVSEEHFTTNFPRLCQVMSVDPVLAAQMVPVIERMRAQVERRERLRRARRRLALAMEELQGAMAEIRLVELEVAS